MWSKFTRNRLATGSAVVILLLVLLTVGAAWVAPRDPLYIDMAHKFARPGEAGFLLGADELGRDVLSRLIFGARVSVYVACGAVVITLLVGGAIGILSGYLRGATDAVIQRFVDGVMSFPWLVLLLTLMMLFGNTLTNVAVVIGLISGIRTSRRCLLCRA